MTIITFGASLGGHFCSQIAGFYCKTGLAVVVFAFLPDFS